MSAVNMRGERAAAAAAPSAALLESLLSAARSRPGGASDQEIREQIGPSVTPKMRMDAYNHLLQKGRLVLKRRESDGVVLYEEVSAEAAAKLRGLGAEERLVFAAIEKCGNVGIWTRDLRFKSGLQQNQFSKVLKTLETRRLVKAVKSVKARNKKFYMLADLAPSKELTGGPWYSDQKEYDTEFIFALYTQLLRFFRSLPHASVQDATRFIENSGISKEKLEREHVQALIDTMLFDGALEAFEDKGSHESFMADALGQSSATGLSKSPRYCVRPSRVHVQSVLAEMPCGLCPLQRECHPGGVISPSTCKYLDEWLDF